MAPLTLESYSISDEKVGLPTHGSKRLDERVAFGIFVTMGLS
jgi:hypothetical protein